MKALTGISTQVNTNKQTNNKDTKEYWKVDLELMLVLCTVNPLPTSDPSVCHRQCTHFFHKPVKILGVNTLLHLIDQFIIVGKGLTGT